MIISKMIYPYPTSFFLALHVTTRFGVQSRDVKSAEIVKVEKMIISENDNIKNDDIKTDNVENDIPVLFYHVVVPYRISSFSSLVQ